MKEELPCPQHFVRNRHHGGFTLIEIMTSTAISLILVAGILGITQTILDNFRDIRGSTLREGDAEVALAVMIGDLEALVYCDVPGSQSLKLLPEDVAEASSGWLLLLSRASDRDSQGRLGTTRTVSYRLAYKDPLGNGGGAPIYALYRSIVDSDDTFEDAIGVPDLLDDYWQHSGSGAPDPTSAASFLAGNIVRVEITFLRADNEEWTTIDQNVEIHENGVLVDAVEVVGGMRSVKISLTSLNLEGAKILQSGAITLESAIERFGRCFVRQVSVMPSTF
jgi:prepilin-type N-terminal cleavage/methylation domain-containing protein